VSQARLGIAAVVLGLPVVCLAGAALLVVAISYRWLTNPPGYVHPGAVVGRTAHAAVVFDRDPQTLYGYDFQEVAFPTAGRATLRGWLIPGPPGATAGVVVAHARGGDRRNYLDQLPFFHDLGLAVLLFDFREHGLSDGAARGMSLGVREAEDVSAAVRYLKQDVGLRRVVTVGQSLGGSSVILAAAADPAIDAVIADSAIASFDDYVGDLTAQALSARPGFRRLAVPAWWPHLVTSYTARRIGLPHLQAPEDVVGRIAPRPLLLIHGGGDTVVLPRHAAALAAAAAGAAAELWVAPGAQHNAIHTAYPVEYRRRVTDFLAAALA
jgi:fermentation-respiration switch protein FrsA (DUF1100 family)